MRIPLVLALVSVVVSTTAVSATASAALWTRSANLRSATIHAIAVDPVRTSNVYAGTARGGVLRSTDGGRHWLGRAGGGLGWRGVRSLAIDPTSPPTVYAGTWGAGIYKSTNGGVSWTGVDLPYGDLGVHALVVDPREPKTVYAGTDHVGVLKTTDGGVTWKEMNAGIRPGGGRRRLEVDSLAIDPRSPKTIYAGMDLSGYGDSLFKTTDGAASWRELKKGQRGGAWEVAVDPRSSAVYSFIRNQFFKSTDGGASWGRSKLPRGIALTLAVHPRTSHLYIGMLDLEGYFGSRRPSSAVYRSLDGGRSWEPFARGLEVSRRATPGTRAPSVGALSFSSQGDALFAGTDSAGIFQYRFTRG
jgi:photosystem II stability/assembly factor-like uncharacterized protein